MFECTPVGLLSRVLWSWPQDRWPTMVLLFFLMDDDSKVAFEMREYDTPHIYMGSPRIVPGTETLGIPLRCDADKLKELWIYCRQIKQQATLHYDRLSDRLNSVPLVGAMLSRWWRQVGGTEGMETSSHLIHTTLRTVFPSYGLMGPANLWTLTEIFLVANEIGKETTEEV